MFISFAILFFVLAKYAWPAITKGIDSRADLIDKGVEYAQNAKTQLDNAQKAADAKMVEAHHKQADIIAEANKMKNEIIEQARDEARVEAKKVMDAAKLSIEQNRKEAEQNLRDEVSKFALQIAQQVTRNQMANPDAQKKLVNQLLDEIETNN